MVDINEVTSAMEDLTLATHQTEEAPSHTDKPSETRDEAQN